MNKFLIFQGMMPEMVLWPMYIGVCVAILYSHFLKIKLGPFVEALIKAKAISPESALSLEELGFDKNKHVLYDLKRKSGLRRLVERCEVEALAENTEPNVEKSPSEEKCVKYYIPDEKVGRADAIYVNGGSSLKMTIIMLVVFLAL
ncbi:MAG: hypothetical protein IKL81_04010, partial [Clostridia bacterium]|nr:hypothetical protein [Clostridia bacterium]